MRRCNEDEESKGRNRTEADQKDKHLATTQQLETYRRDVKEGGGAAAFGHNQG